MTDSNDEHSNVEHLDVHRLIKQHPDRLGYGDAPEGLADVIRGPRIQPSEETSGMTLVEFLRARLDEDEQAARAASGGHLTGAGDWSFGPGNADGVHTAAGTPVTRFTWPYEGEHIARHDPARVLRDIETKRQIVEGCAALLSPDSGTSPGEQVTAEWVLRELAQAHGGHPDYRPEWAP